MLRTAIALGMALAVLGGCAVSTPSAVALVPGDESQASVNESVESVLDRVDLLETLAAGQAIEIDNPYGDVRLRFGGYEHQVEVHGVRQRPLQAADIAVQATTVNGIWVLAPRLPAGELVAEGQRLDLVVYVPEHHPVSARTERGLIEARGLKSDLIANSIAGDIALRGVHGVVQVATGSGSIEAALGTAPVGSEQSLSTRTGNIIVGVDDGLNAQVALSTSGLFATEYSLEVEHLKGQEPNKQATATVGTAAAHVVLSSARGEIRLLRRDGYTPAIAVGAHGEGEGNMKRAQAP